MKHLLLIIGFSFNLLSAQTVKDSSQVKAEQSLLRLRLKLNILKENNSLYIYSDDVFYKIKFTKRNDTLLAINSLDEFLINNCFKKAGMNKSNGIYLVNEFRSDELLRAYRLQRKPGDPTIETIQKYLGLADKLGGFIVLAIFLLQ